jgi:RNA polymerase sigma-70 factor (ECF subfamily)
MDKPTSDRKLSRPEQWLAEHGDALYRYAWFRLQDAALAEDLVQETLLAALQSQDGFAGRSSERTWLTSILKNKLIDHLRKYSREQPFAGDTDTHDEIDTLFEDDSWNHWKVPPSVWDNPSAALEQRQFWEVFTLCMGGLPERQAQTFVLCELEGMDGAEACKVLGMTTSNVWVMLHRARLRLRDCLEKQWFDRMRGA